MVEAGDKIRSYLHLEDEMIVNHLELIGYDRHGNLVEYTESYSRPDKLEVRFVSNNTDQKRCLDKKISRAHMKFVRSTYFFFIHFTR